MAWRISWSLECDHCKKRATFAGSPSSAVEKKARRYGWAFTIDAWGLFRQLCPACGKQPDVRAMYETAETDRGKCGLRYHHRDCDCNGEGGDR